MKLASWSLLGVATLLTACASTPKYMDKVEPQGNIAPLKVQEILVAAQNDLIKVNLILENKDSEPVNYRYRVRWQNVDGFQIWDDEPWKPMLIHGKEKQVVTVVAPSAKASDFRFLLQRDK